MTTYTDLPDTALAQDKPLTQSIARALRDNPLAIGENDPSAPNVIGLDALAIRIASNTPNLVFTDINTDYDLWEFELINVQPQTGGTKLRIELSLNNGASYTRSIDLISDTTGGGVAGIIGFVRLYQPAAAGSKDRAIEVHTINLTSGPLTVTNFGAIENNTPITAVRFNFNGGNVLAGKVVLRPRRKS